MLDFTLTQRGEIPTADVERAIVAAHQRGVRLLLNELTKNVSGRVVNVRSGRLRAGLTAQTTVKAGEVTSTVGFDKRVAFIARFLERGTQRHELGRGARAARAPFGRRRGRRARGPFKGERAGVLRFILGGQVLFRTRVLHPGLRPRPILESAVQIAEPEIRADFEASIGKALGNG